MLYRCRHCQHEEARGCLPTASCGLYFFALFMASMGCVLAALRGPLAVLRGLAPAPAGAPAGVPADPPAGMAWWEHGLVILFGAAGLAVAVAGMWALNFTLELGEYLLFVRRRCPACGARRWSRGFTRGFGL